MSKLTIKSGYTNSMDDNLSPIFINDNNTKSRTSNYKGKR